MLKTEPVMQVTQTAFTVAEYCDQMTSGSIVVNRDYQRSPKVWPPAARSYLIDTILLGYPVPKLSLYQKTDLKTRKTTKEIVDGQQRSQAILEFYKDKMRISGKSDYSGKKFTQLDEPDQQKFVDYSLSVDIFVGANDEEIRQVFRRINSYTVPLNAQEKRHSTYQGCCKWFILNQCELYTETLKRVGVFTESQISRMNDATFLTELCLALVEGIQSASETKLDKFYKDREGEFSEQDQLSDRLFAAFDKLINWDTIHKTALVKRYNLFALLLAVCHYIDPVGVLEEVVPRDEIAELDEDILRTNLGTLAAALESPETQPDYAEFVGACDKATNRIKQRQIRFKWFCRALEPRLL